MCLFWIAVFRLRKRTSIIWYYLCLLLGKLKFCEGRSKLWYKQLPPLFSSFPNRQKMDVDRSAGWDAAGGGRGGACWNVNFEFPINGLIIQVGNRFRDSSREIQNHRSIIDRLVDWSIGYKLQIKIRSNLLCNHIEFTSKLPTSFLFITEYCGYNISVESWS